SVMREGLVDPDDQSAQALSRVLPGHTADATRKHIALGSTESARRIPQAHDDVAAGTAIQSACRPEVATNANLRMISKVLPNARPVNDHIDPNGPQVPCRTYACSHEDCRRIQRPCRDNYLVS